MRDPVQMHIAGTAQLDFDRPEFAPDVRDLTSFGYKAIQQLEETESAERVKAVHLALSGKATWRGAVELPLNWPVAVILLPRLVGIAYSRLRGSDPTLGTCKRKYACWTC